MHKRYWIVVNRRLVTKSCSLLHNISSLIFVPESLMHFQEELIKRRI